MTRYWISLLGLAVIVAACADGTTTGDLTDPNAVPTGGDDAGPDTAVTPPPASTVDSGGGTDAASAVDSAPKTDAAVSLACGKTFDFESSDGSFTHAAIDGANGAAFDAWSYGAAASTLNCHSGSKCFATNLTGPYAQCQRAELRSPVIDLSACAGASSIQVTFWHAYDFLGYTDAAGTTYFDGGIVELSGDGGATWTAPILSPPTVGNVSIAAARGVIGEYTCPGPTGTSSFHVQSKSGFINQSTGWQSFEADVPPALRTSQFMVRFAYASGKSTADTLMALATAKPGWHVDDVAIVVK
jgi:hypothetical protein